jgi:hypothetical protein
MKVHLDETTDFTGKSNRFDWSWSGVSMNSTRAGAEPFFKTCQRIAIRNWRFFTR